MILFFIYLHLQALEDATGDSAVIEHVGGEWQVSFKLFDPKQIQ